MKLKIKSRSLKGLLCLPCIAVHTNDPPPGPAFITTGILFPGGKVAVGPGNHPLISALASIHGHASPLVQISLHSLAWEPDRPGDDDDDGGQDCEMVDEEVVIVEEKKGVVEFIVTFLPAFFSEANAKKCGPRHILALLSFIKPLQPSSSSSSSTLPAPPSQFSHIPLLEPNTLLASPSSRRDIRDADIRDADEVFEMVRSGTWMHEISNPKGLKASLFHYQARAVSWMCYREKGRLLKQPDEGSLVSSSSSSSTSSDLLPSCFCDDLVLQSVIWRRAILTSVEDDDVGGSAKYQEVFWHCLEDRVTLNPPPAPIPSVIVKGGLLCEEM